MANTVFGGQMNKWVKRICLGVLITIGSIVSPYILVSGGLSTVTIYGALILIGFFLCSDKFSNKQRYTGITAVALLFLYLHVFVAPSVSGRVIDRTTKQPIKDAIIHAEYYLKLPTVGGEVPYIVGESLAVTDINGEYKLRTKVCAGFHKVESFSMESRIFNLFVNFFDLHSPEISIKVLHPLWEVRKNIIPLYNVNAPILMDYTWMLKKWYKPIKKDEELLSLGENNVFSPWSGMYMYFKYARNLEVKYNLKDIFSKWDNIAMRIDGTTDDHFYELLKKRCQENYED